MQNPKPFLKWVGGKHKLLPQLDPLLPPKFNNYYEPFLGGGAMFFHLCSTGKLHGTVTLSDVNVRLINCYAMVKYGLDQLITLLALLDEGHSKEQYYKVRSQFQKQFGTHSALDDAAMFIYLNKTCFNGLYRENKAGQFNVPMGSYKSPKILDADNLRACSWALQGVNLQVHNPVNPPRWFNGSYLGDFVYLDPPYVPVSKTSDFVDYNAGGFSEQDQRELFERVKHVTGAGVKVMLSNSDCDFTRRIYGSSDAVTVHQIQAGRSVSSKASGRGKVGELVVTNY